MREELTSRARYSKSRFPAYRYRPGQTPHPVRDPLGHSHGAPESVEALDVEDWHTCESYLFAIDLFNHAYYWEAHEWLEGLWRGTGRQSETGILLQGLIQLTAALLKASIGERQGAQRLAARGAEKLRRHPGVCLGIERGALAEAVSAYADGGIEEAPEIRLIGARPAAGA